MRKWKPVAPGAVALFAVWLPGLVGCDTAHSHDAAAPHAHDHAHHHDHDDEDMHDLMAWVLDPAAGVIWRSAGSITTLEGTEDLAPTTTEGWDRVRHAAAVVSESGHLLMLPGRARDDGDWSRLARPMTDLGLRVIRAAERRDAAAIFDLGGELYEACLACHQHYLVD